MVFEKRFSFPINHTEIFANKRISTEWFARHASVINEVYIDPSFLSIDTKDMNGKNHIVDTGAVNVFLHELKNYGIKVCVIFNDVFADSTPLLNQFKRSLDENPIVDIAVVPNKSWLTLKHTHPHVEIKNTVINLPTYQQVRDGEYDDYDVIYIHDEIIHNHDLYKDIKGTRKFGTVVNYSDCSTHCKLKREHYKLVKIEKYDANKFCKTVKYSPVELLLKRNSIPGFLSEFEYYADVIDIYKLQGRNTTGTFRTAVEIVESVHSKYPDAFPEYQLLKKTLNPISLIKWKHKVRNCGGDCDQCLYCSNILESMT